MKYELTKLIDKKKLDDLCENFFQATQVACSIFDLSQNRICNSSCNDFCNDFHAKNAISCCLHDHSLLEFSYTFENKFDVFVCPNKFQHVGISIQIEGEKIGQIYLGPYIQSDHWNLDQNIEKLKAHPTIVCLEEQQVHQYVKLFLNYTQLVTEISIEKVNHLNDLQFQIKLQKDLEFKNKHIQSLIKENEFSNEKFMQLADNIDSIFWIINNEGKIIYLNKAFEKLSGKSYDGEDLSIDTFIELIHPKEQEDFKNYFSNLLNREGKFEQEIRIVLPSKEIKWIWAKTFSVFDASSGKINYVGVANDITEMKTIQQQLEVAKLKAEESDKLKSAFLANMSHEIRTPMNGILGFSELLSDSLTTELQRKQYIQIIQKSSNSLLAIINDLIDISKIEAGQIQLHTSEFFINRLLLDTEELYQNKKRIHNKDFVRIEAFCELPSEYCIQISDHLKIKQVLTNFVENAFKFTEYGYIELGYKILDEENILYYVDDSGVGIPEDKQVKIFDRFSQADETISRKYGGTGLGLSICKGLIEFLQGRLHLVSDLLFGSYFSFTLPFTSAIESHILKEIHEENRKIIASKKVLIFSDENESVTQIKNSVLQLTTYCVIVKNMSKAIETFILNEIDLVIINAEMIDTRLSDIIMKFKRIRKSPIIVLSHHPSNDEKANCYMADCAGYFGMDCHQRLIWMVERLLSKKGDGI